MCKCGTFVPHSWPLCELWVFFYAFCLDCPPPLTRSEVTEVGGEQKAVAAAAARQDVRQKVGHDLYCCLFLFIYFPVLMAGDPDLREGIRKVEDATTCSLM